MRESEQFMTHLLSAEIFLLDFDDLDVGRAWYVANNLGGSDSIRKHVIGSALPCGPTRRTREVYGFDLGLTFGQPSFVSRLHQIAASATFFLALHG
jgi:hypothetical protein